MRVLRPIVTTAALAGVTALMVSVTAVPAAASTDLPNFRVGLQTIDNGSQIGDAEFTPYASFGGGCSPWAGDPNTYDPDGARLFLDRAPRGVLGNRDFRIGGQVTDSGGSQTGALQWSPWASEGGGVSPYAFDTNGYDPDQYRVCLEVRALPPGIVLNDFRLSIKFVDHGGAEQGGIRQYTPWAADGGGVSPYAFDANAYDPDGFAVGIEVY